MRRTAGIVTVVIALVVGAFLVQRTRPRVPDVPPPSASSDLEVSRPGTAGSPPEVAAPPAAEPTIPEEVFEETDPGVIPLEKLLTWEPPLGPEGPERVRLPGARAIPHPQEGPGLGLDLERTEDGPPLASSRAMRTELGVSLPVDEEDTLRLRGGLRVDSEEGAGGRDRSDTRPSVGVEKRF